MYVEREKPMTVEEFNRPFEFDAEDVNLEMLLFFKKKRRTEGFVSRSRIKLSYLKKMIERKEG